MPLYTGFSNYAEINVADRIRVADQDPKAWETRESDYIKYRKTWNEAAEFLTPDHPLHVDIELSDACNLRCKMCAHGLGTVKGTGFMETDTVIRLIHECAEIGVYSIKFNWRGEASLNPFLPDAVRIAKSAGILEVQLNTNGQPPARNGDHLIRCAENGLDRFIFSIDGFSAKTYESIRVGSSYDTVMKNVHAVIDWKFQNNQPKPLIRIQLVRNTINAHEVDDFIAYWQPKVDDVRISDVMDRGQGTDLSVGDQLTIGRRRCPQPFQRLVIGRDGRVSPCCADWNQAYVIGDVKTTSMTDIWNGRKMKAMRACQENGRHDQISICKTCYVKESYQWKVAKET